MSSLVGKDIELDAVGRQFEPYLAAGCACMLAGPVWCDLRCCFQAVVVIKAAAKTRLLGAQGHGCHYGQKGPPKGLRGRDIK